MVAQDPPVDGVEVVTSDLERLQERLDPLFSGLSGAELLITGGGGFLGYYLVQAPLAWNQANPSADPIRVSVHDRFYQSLPAWHDELTSQVRLVQRDVLAPMPADEPRFDYVIHAASIASPTPNSPSPRSTGCSPPPGNSSSRASPTGVARSPPSTRPPPPQTRHDLDIHRHTDDALPAADHHAEVVPTS